ncbi:hypothetical protein BDB00DRAFT_830721 [Zychaea mexicana]|uniref:uncharacterized protein n=1 Tax=Zychaea mexicana TaxID=64656 RepID=UPI0022FE739B|nr:uncharacterized protein BDB00DRAFT_830721 [Zychaea mexicana]KAI9492009.1 hypothetical protein BDB00DRAFT_830721 [Zychaea mexicana]
MSAFSVSSLLNNERSRCNRPAVLDISNLLCEQDVCPSLSSPESAPSSGSSSPLTSYPLPPIWALKSDERMVMSWTNDSSSSLSSIGSSAHDSIISSTSTSTSFSSISSSSSSSSTPPSTPANSSSSSMSMSNSHPRKLPLKKQHRHYHPHDTSSVISSNHSVSSSCSDDEQASTTSSTSSSSPPALKAKRRRANAKQLEVLNRVFDRTVFPSTQLRAELGRQLGMSPRTVQIWFQNRRQAIRTRERQRLLRIVRDESSSTD